MIDADAALKELWGGEGFPMWFDSHDDSIWCLNHDKLFRDIVAERDAALERIAELEARIAELEGEDNPWGADGEYGEFGEE